MTARLAAIDLGTNTARLLIGEIAETGKIAPICVKRHITRLGGGFTKESGISAEAKERTIAALLDFSREIDAHSVARIKAVATSAVRDAVNGDEFVREVMERTGIRLRVIEGETEGLLTLRGVISELDDISGHFMIFDVGGGSTEYTIASGATPLFTKSLPLGVVRLTEGKGDISAMEEKVSRELSLLKEEMQNLGLDHLLPKATLVGTAGTASTIAAMDLKMTHYDYRLVNNHTVSLAAIREIFKTLVPLAPVERLKTPGLEKGREDLIIAGLLITVKTLETFGFSRMKVSDFGLLEGILLED